MRILITTRKLLTLVISVSIFLPSVRSQTPKRNLKEYKQGVALDLTDQFFDVQKTNQQSAPAREFLWDLWKSHTKGYFKRTTYTREGQPGWCTFFVEPDSTGQWRITLECKSSVCPFISKKRCQKYFRTVLTETYDSLERIDIAYDVYSRSPKKIPDSEYRNPLEFRLIFRSSVSGHTGQL
jgi:hypothetical protein